MFRNKIAISLAAPIKEAIRERQEQLHHYRTEFERDRDRILYSKAFRRLTGKTQVFLPLSHDHVRNRLTHTLEVAQIAKVTAKNLLLDLDLTEAISLGHDLGHTPFGHVGERTLNMATNNCDKTKPFIRNIRHPERGFKHNLHGLRVAIHLEKNNKNYPGMNLTNFTLWGIKHHSKTSWGKSDLQTGDPLPCKYYNNGRCYSFNESNPCLTPFWTVGFYDQYNAMTQIDNNEGEAWSFEGFVVALADEIAQRHHDVEDAIFMNIVSFDELREKIEELFKPHFDEDDRANFHRLKREDNKAYFLPLVSKLIVNFLNKNLINHSIKNLKKFCKKYSIKKKEDFWKIYNKIKSNDAENYINFEPGFAQAHDKFQGFLKSRVLNSYEVQRMDGRGTYIIRKLLKAYLTNPQQLSDATLVYIENMQKRRTTGRKIVEDLKPLEIGKLRAEIDELSKRSNSSFQINLQRGICDHIAGMTDNFALSEFKRLYSIG